MPASPEVGSETQRWLADLAAAIARFEAEVAPHMPAEAPSPSLEDLRLRTPALHPVGCWSTGCARRSPPPVPPTSARQGCRRRPDSRARRARAQVRQPVRRVGGGPAAAAVLRLQHRVLLLGRVPQGGLARGPQGSVRAPASARLTGAAGRRAPAGSLRRLLCVCRYMRCATPMMPPSPRSSPLRPLMRAHLQVCHGGQGRSGSSRVAGRGLPGTRAWLLPAGAMRPACGLAQPVTRS